MSDKELKKGAGSFNQQVADNKGMGKPQKALADLQAAASIKARETIVLGIAKSEIRELAELCNMAICLSTKFGELTTPAIPSQRAGNITLMEKNPSGRYVFDQTISDNTQLKIEYLYFTGSDNKIDSCNVKIWYCNEMALHVNIIKAPEEAFEINSIYYYHRDMPGFGMDIRHLYSMQKPRYGMLRG